MQIKKCCSWLHKKETVISNTVLYLISVLTDRISRDEIYLRKGEPAWSHWWKALSVFVVFTPKSLFFPLFCCQDSLSSKWPPNEKATLKCHDLPFPTWLLSLFPSIAFTSLASTQGCCFQVAAGAAFLQPFLGTWSCSVSLWQKRPIFS